MIRLRRRQRTSSCPLGYEAAGLASAGAPPPEAHAGMPAGSWSRPGDRGGSPFGMPRPGPRPLGASGAPGYEVRRWGVWSAAASSTAGASNWPRDAAAAVRVGSPLPSLTLDGPPLMSCACAMSPLSVAPVDASGRTDNRCSLVGRRQPDAALMPFTEKVLAFIRRR
jgi:hypothetical protein